MLVVWMCLLTSLSDAGVGAANVLGLFPTQARSAFMASEAIMRALAARGHNVTVVSNFPQATPLPNYHDISIRNTRALYENSIDMQQHAFPYSLLDLVYLFFTDLVTSMEHILHSKEINGLVASNVSFDVVFHEMFVDDVFLMLASRFGAPIIAVGPSYILPWAADRFAIPQNPAYIPVLGNGYSANMNCWDRLVNTGSNIAARLAYWWSLVPRSSQVFSRWCGHPAPRVQDLGKAVSLYLVNSHNTLTGGRPLPPQVVEIGGIHLQPVQPLPQELDEWMSSSPFGVVVMSFGSMMRGASLPAEKVQAFLAAFKELPQRVLWKWEDNDTPPADNLPRRLRLMKWLPQRDVLAHSAVRLFISHGGLLGVTEAVVSGVPVLGIPTNMDQANNVASLVDRGAAMHLDYNNITAENLFYAMNRLLHDSGFKANAKLLSGRFLDRPQSPVDTAVYWTEYVIRHQGAPHLQSAAVHLTWYQYYLLDVTAVVLLALILAFTIVYYLLRFCIKQLCLPSKSSKLKSN